MHTATIINGKEVASQLRRDIAGMARARAEQGLMRPGLAVILVGEDAASEVYVHSKIRACEEAGFLSRSFRLAADTSQQVLLALIDELNEDPQIHGMHKSTESTNP